MRLPRIIGLAGHAGVGKTTTARALEEGYGYEVGSFAGGLKEVAVRFFGLDLGPLNRAKAVWASGRAPSEEQKAAAGVVRRRLWEIGRAMLALDPECLDRAAMHFADQGVAALRPGERGSSSLVLCPDGIYRPKVVFDDVRRASELRSIRSRGGEVLWLDGPTSFPVDGRDTEISPSDCLCTVDVSWAANEARAIRASGRKQEARQVFGYEAIKAILNATGWSAAVAPVPVLDGPDDDEQGDEEIEAGESVGA